MPKVYTALVHPIGEDNDCTSVVAALTEAEVQAKVLAVVNSWSEDEEGVAKYATLEEAFAADKWGFYIDYQEHDL